MANYSNLSLAHYSTYNYFGVREGTHICERVVCPTSEACTLVLDLGFLSCVTLAMLLLFSEPYYPIELF